MPGNLEGGGGGQRGRLPLQLLDRRGAAPRTLDCRCLSFLVLFVFAREHWVLETFALPNLKIIPGPLIGTAHSCVNTRILSVVWD